MHTLAYEWATISVLWQRDLKRFLRQPTRLIGALGQPIIFWGVIGGGLSESFQIAGTPVDYREYFYPGVVMMVALFASIFASVSIIEDRHQGFLQAVLAGPGSRLAMVLGKALGSASVALIQIGLFLSLAPLAGFAWGQIDWVALTCCLLATTLGLSAFGLCVAWALDNVQAYHAVQMTFLVPLWVVSGAMFPASGDGLLRKQMAFNPLSYANEAVRQALYGTQTPTAGLPTWHVGFGRALGYELAWVVLALALALYATRARRKTL